MEGRVPAGLSRSFGVAEAPPSIAEHASQANSEYHPKRKWGSRRAALSPRIVIPRRLLRDVKNATALLAAHNLVSTFSVHRGRRRHFHMTSSANTVLDRDDSCVTFTRE